MNYLAHIYLSGNDEELKIGNFIADSVKGNKYLNYPNGIMNGILLHRKIDTFTDTNAIVHRSTDRLKPNFGLYSGVIVDILYDHFLAKNWKDYHPENLEKYIATFYALLNDHFALLPKKVQKFLPIMEEHNWLLSYASLSGIENILFQMNHRVKNGTELHLAMNEFKQYYAEFEIEFRLFFKDLENYVRLVKDEI